MKTYKDITKKYLSENKGRTITTICGIILSISLITAIMFFIKGIHQNFLDDEIDKSGAYHTSFVGLSSEEVAKLSAHPGVENVAIQNLISLVDANNGEYDYKFSLNEVTKGQEHLTPLDIVEGRFGENDSEVVVDLDIIQDMKKKIGDSISLDIDGSKKEYKIVGIIDSQWAYLAEKQGTVVISTDKPALGEETLVLFEGKSKGLRKTLDELSEMTKIEAKENYYYLSYIGAGDNRTRNTAVAIMGAVIISLVIISTVLVIKNAFYISIVSRLKEFGLLKSIGATSKQLRGMILKEATIIAAIGVPLGLFFGTLAIIVVEKVLAMMSENVLISIKIEWWILVIAGILGFVTTYLCALLPAIELKRISPLAAIDNRTGIKKEKIKKRKFSIVEKFLNIRSIMAYRNIKRNKRRYNSTILGLSISMILFIVFTSYMRNVMNDTLGYTDASTDVADISCYMNNYETSKVDSILAELYKIEGAEVLEINKSRNDLFLQVIDNKNLDKEIFKDGDEYRVRRKINEQYSTFAPSIFNNSLKDSMIKKLNEYIVDGKIDADYMKKNNGVIIVKNSIHYMEDVKYKGGVTNLKVGDKMYLSEAKFVEGEEADGGFYDYNKDNIKEFEVVAIVDELPLGMSGYDYVIHNESLYDLIKAEEENLFGVLSISVKVTDLDNKEVVLQKFRDLFELYNMEYYDNNKIAQEQIMLINQIKFLIYGFVIVLGLISCTNIFNTMSTNIIFRKREIAALRAIGMSKKEMRNMIIKEGALYGIISIFYASIIATLINLVLHKQLTTITNFKFNLNIDMIILIGGIGIIVGIIASLIPLRKLDESSIILVNLCSFYISGVYKKSFITYQSRVTGSLMELYPDAEISIVSAITKGENKTFEDKGIEVLASYNYDEGMNTGLFNEVIGVSNILFWIFNGFAIIMAMIYIFLNYISHKKIYKKISIIEKWTDELLNNKNNFKIRQIESGEISKLFMSFNKVNSVIAESLENVRKEKQFLINLLSDISHQLKTPLSSIMLNNELLLKREMSRDMQVRVLESNDGQLSRMKTLTENLLKLAKLDAGAIKFKNERNSIKKSTLKAMQNLSEIANDKNVSLVIKDDINDCFELCYDKFWVEEAILNVIKNCIEHSSNGGEVRVFLVSETIFTRIIIEDDGDGICEKDIDYIFDRFFKSSKSTKKDSAGIGLALAKTIIESQNGSISVSSKEGIGSKFEISFLQS